jgi:hypothetical protein
VEEEGKTNEIVSFCISISQRRLVACDSLTGSLAAECLLVVPCQVTRYLKHSSICYNI